MPPAADLGTLSQKFNTKHFVPAVLICAVGVSLRRANARLQVHIYIYVLQSEYQQVILNILNNAKDALIENKIQNPKIEIILEGKKISINDNAGGIPKNVIDRIFEPYFTTKEQGKGTGMGLYMSKMIIEKNMNGELTVENTTSGALFTVTVEMDNG